jgi:hypothetical protein
MNDTPQGGPPLVYNGDPNDPLNVMFLTLTFKTYVTVQTVDPRNRANDVYTALAEMDWTFIGSGQMLNGWQGFEGSGTFAGSWQPTGGKTPAYLSGTVANTASKMEVYQ